MSSRVEPRRSARDASGARTGRVLVPPPPEVVARVVREALAEDVGAGDLTTELLVPVSARCRARVLLEEPGVVCGLEVLRAVFFELDPEVQVELVAHDGQRVDAAPSELALLEGPARAVLTGERVALNLLSRLSGIATLTARYVAAVAGTQAAILDTRKTTPLLRALERYAVRCGGGVNHRAGLYDQVLVKENHLRLAAGVGAALETLGSQKGGIIEIEVEAETLGDVAEALAAGATMILLDNMTAAEVADAVELAGGSAVLEASGGITLETVRAYAETGVERISVGALTRSAAALEVSLEVDERTA